MIVAEAEASSRQCYRGAARKCVGAACMAWRYLPVMASENAGILKDIMDGKYSDDGEKVHHKRAAMELSEVVAKVGGVTKPWRGYCGAAGKPEVIE